MKNTKKFEWVQSGGYYYLEGDGAKPFKNNPYIMFDMKKRDLWELLKATFKALIGKAKFPAKER